MLLGQVVLGGGKGVDDMNEAWKKQIYNATSWNKVLGSCWSGHAIFKNFLVEGVKLLRWNKKQIDEMQNGFGSYQNFHREKVRWKTQDKKNRARHWVINGAVTQDAMCKYVWVKKFDCKICRGRGTENHRLCHCMWWKNQRLQMSGEVRACEHIAKGDHKC